MRITVIKSRSTFLPISALWKMLWKKQSHAGNKPSDLLPIRWTLAAARRRSADDMYGWDEYTSVSKDRPGRSSHLRHAAEVESAEDRPYGPRTQGADLRLKAVGERASHLKISRLSLGASRSDHGESSRSRVRVRVRSRVRAGVGVRATRRVRVRARVGVTLQGHLPILRCPGLSVP